MVIVIAPADDAVLKTAMRVLLSAARIEVLRRGGEPETIEGEVELPSGHRVNCSVWTFRYGNADECWEDAWLYLDLPLEALARLDPRIGALPDREGWEKEPGARAWRLGWGNEPGSLAWRRPIDDWLAAVAVEVGRSVSFKRAIIGRDLDGDVGVSPKPERDRPAGLVLPDGTYLPATY
jgi:hypothetical protein